MRRLLALSVGIAATLAATLPALAADREDPLTPLVSTAGTRLCFGRDYSPEHLAQHPKQMTKSIRLGFQQPLPRATIDLRTGEPHRIAADCIWWKGPASTRPAAKCSRSSTGPMRSTASSQRAASIGRVLRC